MVGVDTHNRWSRIENRSAPCSITDTDWPHDSVVVTGQIHNDLVFRQSSARILEVATAFES